MFFPFLVSVCANTVLFKQILCVAIRVKTAAMMVFFCKIIPCALTTRAPCVLTRKREKNARDECEIIKTFVIWCFLFRFLYCVNMSSHFGGLSSEHTQRIFISIQNSDALEIFGWLAFSVLFACSFLHCSFRCGRKHNSFYKTCNKSFFAIFQTHQTKQKCVL